MPPAAAELFADIRYVVPERASAVSDEGQRRESGVNAAHAMRVRSARELPGGGGAVGLRQTGFCVVDFRSSVADRLLEVQNPVVYRVIKTPESATSRQVRGVYQSEAERVVARITGARYCFTLHHACRFGERNPKGVEFITAYANFAHTDYTQSILPGAAAMLAKRGVPDEEARRLDVAFVNWWQPVGSAVEQYPLALLDRASVGPSDARSISLGFKVTPDGGGAGGTLDAPKAARQHAPDVGQLVHNAAHRWYYYPRVTPSEALVFLQADSRDGGSAGVFHTAFFDRSAPENPARRRSVELHMLCAFAKSPPRAGAAL